MKKVSWRSALLFACGFLFACLLVTGAPRLIGSDIEEAPPMRAPSRAAYLCAAPAQAQETQQQAQTQPGAEKRANDVRDAYVSSGNPAITLKRDANGNILFHKSYLKTVYQAFSLGDGFA